MDNYYDDNTLGQEELDKATSSEDMSNLIHQGQRKLKQDIKNPYQQIADKEYQAELNLQKQKALIDEGYRYGQEQIQIGRQNQLAKLENDYYQKKDANVADSYNKFGYTFLPDDVHQAMVRKGVDLSNDNAVLTNYKNQKDMANALIKSNIDYNTQLEKLDSNYNHQLNNLGIQREFMNKQFDKIKADLDFQTSIGEGAGKEYAKLMDTLYNLGVTPFDTPNESYTDSRTQNLIQSLTAVIDEAITGVANIATGMEAGELNPVRSITNFLGITNELDFKDSFSSKYDVGWKSYVFNPTRLMDLGAGAIGSTLGFIGTGGVIGGGAKLTLKGISATAFGSKVQSTFNKLDSLIHKAKITGDKASLTGLVAQKTLFSTILSRTTANMAMQTPIIAAGRVTGIAEDRAKLNNRTYEDEKITGRDWLLGTTSALMDTMSIPAVFKGGQIASNLGRRIVNSESKRGLIGSVAKASVAIPAVTTLNLAATEGATEVVSTISELAAVYGFDFTDMWDKYMSDDPKDSWFKEAVNTSFFAGIVGGGPMSLAGSLTNVYSSVQQTKEENKLKANAPINTDLGRINQYETSIAAFNGKIDNSFKNNPEMSKELKDKYSKLKAHTKFSYSSPEKNTGLDIVERDIDDKLTNPNLTETQKERLEKTKKQIQSAKNEVEATNIIVDNMVDSAISQGKESSLSSIIEIADKTITANVSGNPFKIFSTFINEASKVDEELVKNTLQNLSHENEFESIKAENIAKENKEIQDNDLNELKTEADNSQSQLEADNAEYELNQDKAETKHQSFIDKAISKSKSIGENAVNKATSYSNYLKRSPKATSNKNAALEERENKRVNQIIKTRNKISDLIYSSGEFKNPQVLSIIKDKITNASNVEVLSNDIIEVVLANKMKEKGLSFNATDNQLEPFLLEVFPELSEYSDRKEIMSYMKQLIRNRRTTMQVEIPSIINDLHKMNTDASFIQDQLNTLMENAKNSRLDENKKVRDEIEGKIKGFTSRLKAYNRLYVKLEENANTEQAKQEAYIAKTLLVRVANNIDAMASSLEIFMNNLDRVNESGFKDFAISQLSGENENTSRFADLFDSLVDRFQRVFLSFLNNFVDYFRAYTQDMTQNQMFEMIENVRTSFQGLHTPINNLRTVTQSIIKNNRLNTDFKDSIVLDDKSNTELTSKLGITTKAYANNMIFSAALENYIDFSIDISNKDSVPNTLASIVEPLINYKGFVSNPKEKDQAKIDREIATNTLDTNREAMLYILLGKDSFKRLKNIKKYRLDANNSNNITKEEIVNELMDNGRITYLQELFKALSASFITSFNKDSSQTKEAYLAEYKVYDNIGIGNQLLKEFAEYTGLSFRKNDLGDVVDIEGLNPNELRNTLFSLVSSFLSAQQKEKTIYKDISTNEATIQKASSMMKWFNDEYGLLDKDEVLKLPAKEIMFRYMSRNNPELVNSEMNEQQRLSALFGKVKKDTKLGNTEQELLEILSTKDTIKLIEYINGKIDSSIDSRYKQKHFLLFSKDKDTGLEMLMDINNVRKEKIKEIEKNNASNNVLSEPSKAEAITADVAKDNQKLYGIDSSDLHILNRDLKVNQSVDESKMISIEEYSNRKGLAENNFNGLDVSRIFNDKGECNIFFYVPIYNVVNGKRVLEGYAPLRQIDNYESIFKNLGIEPLKDTEYMGGNNLLKDSLPDMREFGEFYYLSKGTQDDFYYEWDEQGQGRTFIINSAFNFQSNKYIRPLVVLKKDWDGKDYVNKVDMRNIKADMNDRDFKSIVLSLQIGDRKSNQIEVVANEKGFLFKHKGGNDYYQKLAKDMITYSKTKKMSKQLKEFIDDYNSRGDVEVKETEDILEHMNIKKLFYWMDNPTEFSANSLRIEIDGSATGVAETSLIMATNRQDIQENMGIFRYFTTDLGLLYASKNYIAESKSFEGKDNITLEDVLNILNKDVYGTSVVELYKAGKDLQEMNSIRVRALMNLFKVKDNMTAKEASKLYKTLRNEIGKGLLTPTNYGSRAASIFTSQSPSSISRRLFDLMLPDLNTEIDKIVKEDNPANIGIVFEMLVHKALSGQIENQALSYMILQANNNNGFKATIEKSNSVRNNNLIDSLLKQVYFSESEVATSEAIFNMVDFNVLSKTLNDTSKYKVDINKFTTKKILEYTEAINKVGKNLMPIIYEGIEDNIRVLNLNTKPIIDTLKSLSYKNNYASMKIGRMHLFKVEGKKVSLTPQFKLLIRKFGIKEKYFYNNEEHIKQPKQILKEFKAQIATPLNYYNNLLKSSNVSIMNTNQLLQGISTRSLSPFADTMNVRNAATTHYRDIFSKAIGYTYLNGFKTFASYLKNPNNLLQFMADMEKKNYPLKNKIEYIENYIAQNINRFVPKEEFDSVILAYRKSMLDTNQKIDNLHKKKFGGKYGLHFSLEKKTSSTHHKQTTSSFVKDNTSDLNKENIVLSARMEQGKKQLYSKLYTATDIQTINSIMTDVVRLVEHDIEATVMNPVMSVSGKAHGTIYDAAITAVADSDSVSNMWNEGFENAKQNNPYLALFNYLSELHSSLEEEIGREIPINETSNMLAFVASKVDYVNKMNFNNIVTEGTSVSGGIPLKVGSKTIHVFGQKGSDIVNSPLYQEYYQNLKKYIDRGVFKRYVRDSKGQLRLTQVGQVIMNKLLLSERIANANSLEGSDKQDLQNGLNDKLLYVLPNLAFNVDGANIGELDLVMNRLPETKEQFDRKKYISKTIKNYSIKENTNKQEYNMNAYLKNNAGKILTIEFNDNGSLKSMSSINTNNGNTNGFIEVIGNVPNSVGSLVNSNQFQSKLYDFINSVSSNGSINMTFNPIFQELNKMRNIKSLVLNYVPSESNLKTLEEQYLDDNKHTRTIAYKKDDRRLNRVNTNYEINWNKYPIDDYAQNIIDINNNRDIDEKTMNSMLDNNMINLWGLFHTGTSGGLKISPITVLEPQIFSDEMIKKLEDNGVLEQALDMVRCAMNENAVTPTGYYTSRFKFYEKERYGNESNSQRQLRQKQEQQDEFEAVKFYMDEIDDNTIGENNEQDSLEMVDYDEINSELSVENDNAIITDDSGVLDNINDFYNKIEDDTNTDTEPNDDLKKKSNFKYQLDRDSNSEPDLDSILNSPNTLRIGNRNVKQEIDSYISSINNREVKGLISQLFNKLNEQITDNVEFYIANDALMNGSRGFTTFRNGKVYVVVSKKNYQGNSNTLAHEFIHGALYQSTMIEHSLGVMEYSSNLRRIQHQIVDIIEKDENLMRELGLLDEYNNPNNIFYAIKGSFEEFSAYFLTDIDKLNYISNITRKDVAKKNGNSYTQKLFNLIKTALSKILQFVSMGYYKHNPSMLEDLKRNIEKLSQYNSPEKAYKLDNTTYNKIMRKLDGITRTVLLETPIINILTTKFESYEGYLRRNNISDAEVKRITREIRDEWKEAFQYSGLSKFFKMFPVIFPKTPIHREIALSLFNEVLRRHNNVFTREISGILQSFKILSPNNLSELERLAGKTSALQQELNIYLNNQKEMLDGFFDNAISQEAKDMLKKLDDEWSNEEYKDDIENDMYRMKRFSPTERFNRSVTSIFETGLFSSSNSRWLRLNNQEIYPNTIAMLLRGDIDDVDNSIKDIKGQIKDKVIEILKASKYKKELSNIKNMTNNLETYLDEMTWELGYQRLAGGKSQKGLQNVSEILNRLGMYDDIRLIGEVSLKDLHSVLLQAISPDNVNRGNLRDLLSQIHYLTTLQSIRHIKDIDADFGNERANSAYHFNTQMYRDRIETINDVIGDTDENFINFVDNMHSVGLILNSLSISSKLREAYIPDEKFQDIILMELEQQKLLAVPSKENMEEYKAIQERIDSIEQEYDRTVHEFIQYDFTRDYSADTFIPYQMNEEVHIVEIDKINPNEKDDITEDDIKEYYKGITGNNHVNNYKEAIDFMLSQGYKAVDEFGITKDTITDDDYKHRRITLKYVGNEVNRDSLTKFTMLGQSFENKGNDLDKNLSYKNTQLDKIKAKSKEEQARSYASIFYDINDKKHLQHITDKLSYKNEMYEFNTDDKKKVEKKKNNFIDVKTNKGNKEQIIFEFMETNEKYRAISGSSNLYRTQMNRFTFENLTDVDTDIRKSMLELTKLTYRQKVTENLNKDLIKSIIKDNIKMRENGVKFDNDAYVKIYDSNYEQSGLSRAEKIEQKATLGINPRMPENVIYQIGMLLRAYNEDIPQGKLTQLYIPRDIMNLIIGVETKTLGSYIGQHFSNPIVTKALNWLGYRGSQMLNDTKSNIIIRNPSVLLKNFTSSCLSLTSIGMSIPQIATSVQSTIEDIMNYQKDLGQLYNLLSQRDALKETVSSTDERKLILEQVENEIASYSKRLSENPVYVPMQMGADTNIVNETVGDTSYATELYRGAANKIWNMFDKQKIGKLLENKFGTTIDKVNDEVLMTTESEAYKAAVFVNRFGDIAPRIIAYHHYKRQGYTDEKAFELSRTSFIDYITPLESSAMRFTERVGAFPFLRFAIRAIPAAIQNLMTNPASTMVSIGSTTLLEAAMPNVVGLSIYGEFANVGDRLTSPFRTTSNIKNWFRFGWLF